MKKLIGILGILVISFSFMNASAQKIKTKEGDASVLKNEPNINIEFTYDNISVGKFSDEKDYIKKHCCPTKIGFKNAVTFYGQRL